MERKQVEKFYFKKIKQLKKFDKAYFQDDNPIISDKEYDQIKQEIFDLLSGPKSKFLSLEYPERLFSTK